MTKLFEKMGAFLVDALKLDQPGKGKAGMQQELQALSAGGKSAVRAYYVRKMSVLLAVLAGGLLLSVLGLTVYLADAGGQETQLLDRPGYGESDRMEALEVQVEGEDGAQPIEVTVQARKYTDQEKKQLLDRALEALQQKLPGENASLDEVRTALVLPGSMENGAVKVSWMTVPYGIIGEDGSILSAPDENGTLVEIQGTLDCSGQEAVYEVYAKVFPPELSAQEAFRRTLRKEVEQADADGSYEKMMKLPEHAGGKSLIWSRASQNPFPALLALTLLSAACLYLEMDSRVHQRAEQRKNQLMLDYPDLMWKMTMLLGAGQSIKGVFTRIAGEYQRQRKNENTKDSFMPGKKAGKRSQRYVYEEVARTCYEMQSGISESQAYERFGKRCQLPEYIRLGSVLSQNLKKGSKGLVQLLEQEAETSLNDRRNRARKIGEQAGTKLLLPMMLMLAVVLVILMVPAFLSF